MALKLLYITTFARSRFGSFAKSSIAAARELGIEYHIASNETGIDLSVKDAECKELGIYHHHIDINRSPAAVRDNRLAKKQISELIEKYRFDAIHCNTPMGGVLGRLCGKKYGIKTVIYQAHGFHFWTGAPKKNWLIYYPVEKYLARYTDILITINKEDYKRAENFHLKKGGKIYYVHGVGVDTHVSDHLTVDIAAKRRELGIDPDKKVFITVGELIPRKNHLTAIDAFIKADIDNAILMICGRGELENAMREHITSLNAQEKVIMLGFRSDVSELLAASNYFVFPSLQEGLPLALMEAMSAGLPCIAANIRGNTDLLGDDYRYLFAPHDVDKLAEMFRSIVNEPSSLGKYCKKCVEPFDFEPVVQEFKSVYADAERRCDL